MYPTKEYRELSNGQLFKKITYYSWKQGVLDTKLKRYKYDSKTWNERSKEFEENGLERVHLEAEYNRRFCGVNYDDNGL